MTINTITITFDLPDGRMSGHANGHWRKKAKLTKSLRFAASVTTIATGKVPASPWDNARIDYRFFVGDNRRTDAGNLVQRCKPILDGIVDAGVIHDDNWRVLKMGDVFIELDRENPRVEITLTRGANP